MKAKNKQATLLFTLIILQTFLLLGVSAKLYFLNSNLSKQIEDTQSDISLLKGDVAVVRSMQKPAVLAKENNIAIPELKITLPYNDITKTLEYYTSVEFGQGSGQAVRLTSTLVDPSLQPKSSNLSCSELVRLHLDDVEPYSPWEEKAGSVKLADGRTLYIMAAKAFANNEATTEECATTMWQQLTPMQLADEFKKAQSY